jgi:type IV secretion system protein VirB10
LLSLGDSVLRAAAQAASGAGPAASVQADRRRREFLDAAGDARGATVIARLEPAGSPYTLRAGTVIPGALLSGINSDLPGDIVAQVSRNVYDSRTQRTLLIPKGARLIGTYDNQVVAGQGRLLVAWTRLILPDGRSLRLPGLALKDLEGQTGGKDRVDTHWQHVFGKALLLSAISAGAQLSQPQQTSVFAAPSAGQVAAGAVGHELSNVALEILRRGMDVAPTITIRQGHPFNVFLNGDLVFDGPYEEEETPAHVTRAERP